MHSDQAEFWDRRYRDEGPIWGENPSPTALIAARYLQPSHRVLEVGFGYGRDLRFLLRNGCHVAGIDLSITGMRHGQKLLEQHGLTPDALMVGRFEDSSIAPAQFDGVFCHRLVHLLVTRESIARFVAKVAEVLRPGGYVFLAARNLNDLDPSSMVMVEDGVYEYKNRPGHRIRFWDERTFRDAFGESFNILLLTEEVENESVIQPVECHFTVMVAQIKK